MKKFLLMYAALTLLIGVPVLAYVYWWLHTWSDREH